MQKRASPVRPRFIAFLLAAMALASTLSGSKDATSSRGCEGVHDDAGRDSAVAMFEYAAETPVVHPQTVVGIGARQRVPTS